MTSTSRDLPHTPVEGASLRPHQHRCALALMVVATVLFMGCQKDTGGVAFGGITQDVDEPGVNPVDVVESDVAEGPEDTKSDSDELPTSCLVSAGNGLPGFDYRDNDTPCDDGNACTIDDVCLNGVCVGGSNRVCDGEGPCREGACDPTTGCYFNDVEDDTECAVACFGEASCQSGTCTPKAETAVVCQESDNPCVEKIGCDSSTGLCTVDIYKLEGTECDTDENICSLEFCDGAGSCEPTGEQQTCQEQNTGNPCWTYTCTKKTGCVPTNFVDGLSCDDNNPCTVNDACTINAMGQKTCLGNAVEVDDGNPCTNDACVDGEVTHSPIDGLPCDPSSPCSSTGMCDEGICQPDTPCECDADSDCAPPTNLCAGVMICDKSGVEPACKIKPGSQVVCGQASKDCHYSTCEPVSGFCVELPVADGLSCDDGDACTGDDLCAGGSCIGAFEVQCDDGFYCNGPETCDSDQGCLAGIAPNPNDGVGCTVDSCDEITDTFVHTPNHALCSDALFCNGEEICTLNGCAPGLFIDLEDGNPCTDGICDEVNNTVVQSPKEAPCSDGDPCTSNDTCVAGVCVGDVLQDEGQLCNGLDDDCDGITDENCSFSLVGRMMGDGYTTAEDGEHTLLQCTGTPRFVGTSSNGAFVLRAGLPQGE